LPAELVALARAAEPALAATASPAARALVILDLRERRLDAPGLGAALGTTAFEAEQRLRRGGYQLHRVTSPEQAAAETAAIAAAGVRVLNLDEADVLAQPIEVTGGRLEPRRLLARTAEGHLEWSCDDLLLVVRGPIQRQLTASAADLKRVKLGTPSEGVRFHLHRLSDRRPLELDPDAFEFGDTDQPSASSLLRLTAWLEGFTPKPTLDDQFRTLPPALAPAVVDDDTLKALGGTQHEKKDRVLLDNLGQFRFYSAWRAAVERAR
jgi:hypothetical protein